MSARLYVEGGGDRRAQQSALRQAFATLFENAGFKRPQAPEVICTGSRGHAFREFCNAFRQHGAAALLLVDSESAVTQPPWAHVRQQDNWQKPKDASEDQLHLMVQIMENSFLCDRKMLAAFFGKGFNEKHLPGSPGDVESLAKASVLEGLSKATRGSTRGVYAKGAHSADLLKGLNPDLLRRAAPHFERLLEALAARLSADA